MKKFFSLCLLAFCCMTLQAEVRVISSELALATKPGWGESPIWNVKTGELYWIDMRDHTFHISLIDEGKDQSFSLPEQPGTIILTRRGNRVIIPLVSAIYAYDFEKQALEKIIDNPNLQNGKPNRFNDGDCDPAGRLWVGTENKDASAVLYRIDGSFKPEQMESGVQVSNGLCFSKDKKTLYYIDSNLQRVDAFDYDNRSGNISNRRTVIRFDKATMGEPDGMTIDTEGTLWVCSMTKGCCVSGWNPATGEMIAKVELPTKNVLACAFGGKKMDVLYITTENGVYKANTGTKGIKPYLFNE